MNSDRHNKYNANNEDLGLFLPNSIIPDIMQELDGRAMKVGPSKLRSQQTYGMSLDSEPEKVKFFIFINFKIVRKSLCRHG
jgi:hypothetical protein